MFLHRRAVPILLFQASALLFRAFLLCHSERRFAVFNKKYAAVTRGPGWGGRAIGASRAPRKVLSVIARSAATRQSEQNPAVIPSPRPSFCGALSPLSFCTHPLCHSEEVARPTKNLIQSHSERSEESISTLNFCEQLAVSFFSCTFLCKKVPKSFCTV